MGSSTPRPYLYPVARASVVALVHVVVLDLVVGVVPVGVVSVVVVTVKASA